MKKLAAMVALVLGMSSFAYAADTEAIVTPSGGEFVTIGGVQVPMAMVVVGAVIGGLVIVSVAQSNNNETIITVATATHT